MGLSIKQVALNDLNGCRQEVVAAEERFNTAAQQVDLSLDFSRIEGEFQVVCRAGFKALQDLLEIKKKNESSPQWKMMDMQVQGGSLAGLRDLYIKDTNARLHAANALYLSLKGKALRIPNSPA